MDEKTRVNPPFPSADHIADAMNAAWTEEFVAELRQRTARARLTALIAAFDAITDDVADKFDEVRELPDATHFAEYLRGAFANACTGLANEAGTTYEEALWRALVRRYEAELEVSPSTFDVPEAAAARGDYLRASAAQVAIARTRATDSVRAYATERAVWFAVRVPGDWCAALAASMLSGEESSQ